MDDRVTIELPRQADPTAAFRAFYAHEFDAQVRRAYLLIRSSDDANEIVQDAMIGVYERWDELDNPGGYLNRSVLNGCRDLARRRAVADRGRRSLRPMDHAPAGDVLDDVLAALPFNQRAAVVLRYYGGWSAAQIADALGCSPNSVGPWITRALDTLRKELS